MGGEPDTPTEEPMENIQIRITDENLLILTVDLNKECGPTQSRRSIRIASTEGNLALWKDGAPLPNNVRVNCNILRSLTAEEKQAKQERNASGPFLRGLHGRTKR
jgi:hypothetical protein